MINQRPEIGEWQARLAMTADGELALDATNEEFNSEFYLVGDNSKKIFEEFIEIAEHCESVGGMTSHAIRVGRFMRLAGQPVRSTPEIPSRNELLLRCRLILEEVLEFIDGAGFGVVAASEGEAGRIESRFGLKLEQRGEPDYEAMIDACADIDFVNTGTILSLGAGDLDLQEEVDDANLRKFDRGFSIAPDGRLIKPPGWTPPSYGCVERYADIESHTNRDGVSEDFGIGIDLTINESN